MTSIALITTVPSEWTPDEGRAEIGYRVAESGRRQDAATEAVSSLLRNWERVVGTSRDMWSYALTRPSRIG